MAGLPTKDGGATTGQGIDAASGSAVGGKRRRGGERGGDAQPTPDVLEGGPNRSDGAGRHSGDSDVGDGDRRKRRRDEGRGLASRTVASAAEVEMAGEEDGVVVVASPPVQAHHTGTTEPLPTRTRSTRPVGVASRVTTRGAPTSQAAAEEDEEVEVVAEPPRATRSTRRAPAASTIPYSVVLGRGDASRGGARGSGGAAHVGGGTRGRGRGPAAAFQYGTGGDGSGSDDGRGMEAGFMGEGSGGDDGDIDDLGHGDDREWLLAAVRHRGLWAGMQAALGGGSGSSVPFPGWLSAALSHVIGGLPGHPHPYGPGSGNSPGMPWGGDGLPPHLSALMASDRDFGPDDYEALLALDDAHRESQARAAESDRMQLASSLPLIPMPRVHGAAASASVSSTATDEVIDLDNSGAGAGRGDVVSVDVEAAQAPPHSSATCTAVNEECAICKDDMPVGETVKLIPACLHKFHPDCIDTWIRINPSCPVCKASVRAVG